MSSGVVSVAKMGILSSVVVKVMKPLSQLLNPTDGLAASLDSKVYIWRKDTGTLMEVLSGHEAGSVNAVAWNPAEVGMFASCSDDRTIRICTWHRVLDWNIALNWMMRRGSATARPG